MGTNNDSRHIERDGLLREQNTDTHSPVYGIDRYAWNQGYDAKYDFQIFENQEPCLISRGGVAKTLSNRATDSDHTPIVFTLKVRGGAKWIAKERKPERDH